MEIKGFAQELANHVDKDNNNIDNMFAATRVISVVKTFPGYGVPAMIRVAESRVIWARCYGQHPNE